MEKLCVNTSFEVQAQSMFAASLCILRVIIDISLLITTFQNYLGLVFSVGNGVHLAKTDFASLEAFLYCSAAWQKADQLSDNVKDLAAQKYFFLPASVLIETVYHCSLLLKIFKCEWYVSLVGDITFSLNIAKCASGEHLEQLFKKLFRSMHKLFLMAKK